MSGGPSFFAKQTMLTMQMQGVRGRVSFCQCLSPKHSGALQLIVTG
jgi:hypothetical protein